MGANRVNPFEASGTRSSITPNGSSTSSNDSPSLYLFSISDALDGGNIEFVSQQDEDEIVVSGDGGEEWTNKKLLVQLKIKVDPYTELEKQHHGQYFCFRATLSGMTLPGFKNVEYVIINASEASYPDAFQDYTVCFTETMTDTLSWRRNPTTVYDKEKGTIRWTTTHTRNGSIYFSYFPPFTQHQHMALIDACASRTEVGSLGQSLFGRDLDCVVCGNGPMVAWIIQRQHPGEAQAEYFAEGLLNRLLGLSSNGDVDGLVRRVLQLYTFYIVPNMNPDGSLMGHLRTNAVGANLNREWATDEATKHYTAPSLERSPEVYYVWQKMQMTGVDFFLDVHADEEFPYNFLMSAKGTLNWGPRLQMLHGNFVDFYMQCNPDIQAKFGYATEAELPVNISLTAVANHFNCLSMVLEMPYKDCKSNPNPDVGWSPHRCRALGASVLQAMDQIHPFLRDEQKWMFLPDKYVEPVEDYRKEEGLSDKGRKPNETNTGMYLPEKEVEPAEDNSTKADLTDKEPKLVEDNNTKAEFPDKDVEPAEDINTKADLTDKEVEPAEDNNTKMDSPDKDAEPTEDNNTKADLPDRDGEPAENDSTEVDKHVEPTESNGDA